MATLKLAHAEMIINTALEEGRNRNLAPLSAAVLDAGRIPKTKSPRRHPKHTCAASGCPALRNRPNRSR